MFTFYESYLMLGSLINTQDIEGNNTDWVPAFIEITAQNMHKKKHKILNETLSTD